MLLKVVDKQEFCGLVIKGFALGIRRKNLHIEIFRSKRETFSHGSAFHGGFSNFLERFKSTYDIWISHYIQEQKKKRQNSES
jgi:hypothetical protein